MPRYKVVRVRRMGSNEGWIYGIFDSRRERVLLVGRGISGREEAHRTVNNFVIEPQRTQWYLWFPESSYR